MLKRTTIATAVVLAVMLLAEILTPWPPCRLGRDPVNWWRCVQFELAAQRADERTARLDAIEHGE